MRKTSNKSLVIRAMSIVAILYFLICNGISAQDRIKLVKYEIADSTFFRNLDCLVNSLKFKHGPKTAPCIHLLIAQKGPKENGSTRYFWFEKTNPDLSAPMVIRLLGFDGSSLENGENFVQYKNRRYVFDQPLINSGIVRHPRAITIKREPFDRKNLLRWYHQEYIWREPDSSMRLYNYTEESRQDSLYILDVPYMEYKDEESHVKKLTDGQSE